MQKSAASPTRDGRVYHVSGWRVPVLWLLGAIVRGWCRTLRVKISDGDRATAGNADRPLAVMLWHNRLFLVPWMLRVLRRGRPAYALVSASRDGATLAQFFEYIGIHTVRGSSSRFGREALRDLISMQRAGHDIAITPDGPRGPIYEMKPGGLLAARRARSPILLVGVEYLNAWRLRSWDRFCIPKPFSRVVVRCEMVEPSEFEHASDAVVSLRARLLALGGETEDSTGAPPARGPAGPVI